MGKINILSSKVFNRIAAGEVVERPSSVVKELVENSIDAGSKNITVEIVDGGITQIIITDDGCGIEKQDLPKAIMPHATSKICNVEDLDCIKTLGFRGEALASIVSVSKFSILSKTKNSEIGASIYVEGGENQVVEDSPAVDGTVITVNNLFYNTPVRAKFLKTPKSEENEITNTMARFILGNYNLAFKYIVNGKVIYQSFGEGFESAFISIYGVEAISNCHFIDTEKNGIKITGYIGKPSFTKPNRSYQTIFLNDRFILNQTVSSSISNAYSSYLMKRQYPFYALAIKVPNEYVDVNVHPNKIDVRFMNNQVVYSTLYSVCSSVLDGIKEVLNIVVPEKKVDLPKKEGHHVINNRDDKYSFDKITVADSGTVSPKEVIDKIEEEKQNNTVNDIFLENKAYLEKLEREKMTLQQNIFIKQEEKVQTEILVDKEFTVIGQALNTFLILEDGEDLYLIDQHAAHERLLFDKIVNSVCSNNYEIQPLLMPYILNTNSTEFDFLSQKLQTLKEFGLDIEEFGGNSFKVSAVPIYLLNMNLDKFFDEVLSDMNILKTLSVKELLMEKLAQKACKSAIKSGDKLDSSEIDCLLQMMKGDIFIKCPHGRPVTIKITRNEIDKWFKRIV